MIGWGVGWGSLLVSTATGASSSRSGPSFLRFHNFLGAKGAILFSTGFSRAQVLDSIGEPFPGDLEALEGGGQREIGVAGKFSARCP